MEEVDISAGLVFASGLGATDAGFGGAVWVAGTAAAVGVAAVVVSSSQSITSSCAAGGAGAGFVVGVDLGADALEVAPEIDELRLVSASCRRAIRSAFLPV